MAEHNYSDDQLDAVRNSTELEKFREVMNSVLVETGQTTMEAIELCLVTHVAGVVLESILNIPVRSEVRPSSVAGLGVFALVDIEPGQIVTLYPAHCLINRKRPDDSNCLVNPSLPTELAININRDIDLLTQYMYSFENINIVGHPKMPLAPHYHGHMINDSCTLAQQGDNYDKYSTQHANVDFLIVPAAVAMVALQKVPAGGEFFNSYGEEYWKSHM